MELHINWVMIEASRKCNMKCRHCLRGASQRKTIDNSHIHKLMGMIDSIGTLNIGGGEPTLAMETLEYIRQRIAYGSCDVGNFYLVTNGKAINVDKLAELFYGIYNVCSDNEMSQIGFSFDQFHLETFNWAQKEKQERNFQRLKDKMLYEYGLEANLGDCDIVTKHSDNTWSYKGLFKEGRGREMGTRDAPVYSFEEDEYGDIIQFNETELYLSCTGHLIAGCNWSYHSADTRNDIQIAHIDEIHCQDDLIEAIRAYNRNKQDQETLVS